jgi:hypothetical protein
MCPDNVNIFLGSSHNVLANSAAKVRLSYEKSKKITKILQKKVKLDTISINKPPLREAHRGGECIYDV